MEKPILFSTEMVKAILANRKNQTRRIIKIQPPTENHLFAQIIESPGLKKIEGKCHWILPGDVPSLDSKQYFNWPYQVGDILWVREAFTILEPLHVINGRHVIYKADMTPDSEELRQDYIKAGYNYKWKSGRFMKKKYSRIFLKVTGLRVERLQDITEENCLKEGVEKTPLGDYLNYDTKKNNGLIVYRGGIPIYPDARASYISLWESINGKGSWDLNPMVFVIEFKRS
jgi:hypothetical protein